MEKNIFKIICSLTCILAVSTIIILNFKNYVVKKGELESFASIPLDNLNTPNELYDKNKYPRLLKLSNDLENDRITLNYDNEFNLVEIKINNTNIINVSNNFYNFEIIDLDEYDSYKEILIYKIKNSNKTTQIYRLKKSNNKEKLVMVNEFEGFIEVRGKGIVVEYKEEDLSLNQVAYKITSTCDSIKIFEKKIGTIN